MWQDVYALGGPDITDPSDCCIYLINAGELVLIDSGVGGSYPLLIENIRRLGFDPQRLKAIIATHAHIDHIGAMARFQREYGLEIVAHQADAGAMETGRRVGAEFYRVSYEPCRVTRRITEEAALAFGPYQLHLLHIPGHSPGSLAVYVDMAGKRVLFGQDIHGPYIAGLGADPAQAAASLEKLISLKADILCEGHFGIYQPAVEVKRYIEGYLRQLRGS